MPPGPRVHLSGSMTWHTQCFRGHTDAWTLSPNSLTSPKCPPVAPVACWQLPRFFSLGLTSPIHQPRAWGARFHGDFLPAPGGGFSGNEATVISSMWYELGGAEQSASLLSNPTPSPGAGNPYLSGLAGRQAGCPTCTSAHVSFSSSICPMLCLPGFQHSHSTTLQREPGSKLIQKWREL